MSLREHWELFVRQGHPGTYSAYQHVVLADFESRATALIDKWFGNRRPAALSGFVVHDDLRTKWVMLELVVATKRYALRASHNSAMDVDSLLLVVSEMVSIIETLAHNGTLRILQDLASTSASVLAIYLKKMFPTFTRGQQGAVASLLMRVMAAYEKASGGETDVPTAFVVRFIRRVLAHLGQVFEQGTQQHAHAAGAGAAKNDPTMTTGFTPLALSTLDVGSMTGASASGAGGSGSSGTDTIDALLAELGAFANPAPEFDFTALDDQYWSALFPSDTIVTSADFLTPQSGMGLDSNIAFGGGSTPSGTGHGAGTGAFGAGGGGMDLAMGHMGPPQSASGSSSASGGMWSWATQSQTHGHGHGHGHGQGSGHGQVGADGSLGYRRTNRVV